MVQKSLFSQQTFVVQDGARGPDHVGGEVAVGVCGHRELVNVLRR